MGIYIIIKQGAKDEDSIRKIIGNCPSIYAKVSNSLCVVAKELKEEDKLYLSLKYKCYFQDVPNTIHIPSGYETDTWESVRQIAKIITEAREERFRENNEDLFDI